MNRALAQYGLSPAGSAGFGLGAGASGFGLGAGASVDGVAGFSTGALGAAGSAGSLGLATGFGLGRACCTGAGFAAGTAGTFGTSGGATGAGATDADAAAEAEAEAEAGGATLPAGSAAALAGGGVAGASVATGAGGAAGSALTTGAGTGGLPEENAYTSPPVAANTSAITTTRPPPPELLAVGTAGGTDTRRLAGAADTGPALRAAELEGAGRAGAGLIEVGLAAAGFSLVRFASGLGSTLAAIGALTGGSALRLDSGAADVDCAAFAGGSGGFELAATSDIEPPASRKASCKSSAACFITVRSSGAGISASDFVSGKKDAAGFSGAVLTAGRVDGFIEPKPIIVDLRRLGGFDASAATAGVFDEVAAGAIAGTVVVAGADSVPLSPPPAS